MIIDGPGFDSERLRLTAIATKVLGDSLEADDVVQEAWLRFSQAAAVDDPPAWLTTVVTRMCLDRLRRRSTRSAAETSAGLNAINAADTVDPEADSLLSEQVGEAMTVVLDTLAPAERTALILHDVFGYAFEEIAPLLGRSHAATRQLASRGRRKLAGASESAREQRTRTANREVVDAFLSAARDGELSDLLDLLAPDAVMRADSTGQRMGARLLYDGAPAVAARFHGGARGAAPTLIDGEPGLAWIVRGRVRVAFVFHITDRLVREIELIADPEILATMTLIPEEWS